MRILTVSHFYERHGGGIERVAGQLCRQFARMNAQSIWVASASDDESPDGIETVPLACVNPIERLTGLPMPLPGPRAIRALAGEVRRSDAVIIHDALYVTSILAMMLARIYGKPSVLIQHIAGIPFSSRALRMLMALANRVVTRPMLRSADALVFISDSVRHDLLGTPARRRYRLLWNGIDRTIFHPGKSEASTQGAPVGVPDPLGGRRILFVGRYVEKKGLAVLRALAASRPDLTFFMVGSGPIRVGKWGLANLHDLGTRTALELAELYRWADLLLLPSVGEGFPLVIQEAMACGLPVVCGEPSHRADPDAAAWLRGVAIDLADPEGSARRTAEAIDGLTMSCDERLAMTQFALARYDWETMARGLLDLIGGKRSGEAA